MNFLNKTNEWSESMIIILCYHFVFVWIVVYQLLKRFFFISFEDIFEEIKVKKVFSDIENFFWLIMIDAGECSHLAWHNRAHRIESEYHWTSHRYHSSGCELDSCSVPHL
jgi:hypothetical protein